MKSICQRLAISTVGALRCLESSAISSRMRVRFCRNWGLSSSQSGTYYLANFSLHRASWCRRVVVLVTFDRPSFKGVFYGSLGVHECRHCTLEAGIFLPIISEVLQIRLERTLPATLLAKVDLNGFNEQLIDGAAFNFAEGL